MSVDAVNERLNGLVTLLQAVGLDAMDKGDMDRVKNYNGGGGGDRGKASDAFPNASQLNDEQIEAIIRKLQQAQAEAPQIIAALEAHAEARSLSGGRQQQQTQQQQQQHQQQQEEEEDDDDDEDDDDANYPMVGHGISDEISVVSDLTTPTVVNGTSVPEEEHYRESLPPMIIGGGPSSEMPPMMINPTKRKNLVNQVRPPPVGVGAGVAGARRNVIAAPNAGRTGGAAAARLKNYQDTMAKLHENPHSKAYVGPQVAPSTKKTTAPALHHHAKTPVSPTGSTPSRQSSGSSKNKKKPSSTSSSSRNITGNFNDVGHTSKGSGEWDSSGSNGDGWNAFESKTARNSTAIDNDGFLFGGDSFDPFNTGSPVGNPFKSSAGDLAFGASGAFGSPSAGGFEQENASSRGARTKPKKNSSSSSTDKGIGVAPPRKSTSAGSTNASANARPRRSRRASLAT